MQRHVCQLLLALLLTSALHAAPDKSALPEIFTLTSPQSGSTEELNLLQTGIAERRLFFIPIYRMAHYMPSLTVRASILDAPGPKAVQLVFLRKIGGERIQREFLQIIRKNVTGEEWSEIEDSAKAYSDPFARGDTRRGDTFSVAWVGKGTLVSHFNGTLVSSIRDPQFAKVLWSIWVGPDSVVDRNRLLQKVHFPSLHGP